MNALDLKAGEWVEVKSKEEILRTLDKRGQLEGLPFMPQMFQYCGQRLRVFKRAHKTCDTVNDYKGRKMRNAVHLAGIRCNGAAYSGCEAACLIFWKDAWLRRVGDVEASEDPSLAIGVLDTAIQCQESDVWSGTKATSDEVQGEAVHVCQATVLPAATEPLASWDPRQYVEDLASGNVRPWTMVCGLAYMSYRTLCDAGIHVGRPLRWIYDFFKRLIGGVPYPHKYGKIAAGKRTPDMELNLQPGEWVRVKRHEDILATLNVSNKNRGLFFDAEMVPYCGRTFRVLKRVTRIINEKTGRLTELKNPCIMLEGAVCTGRYSECRLFCPRSIYSYWREIWLERVPEPDVPIPKVNVSDSSVKEQRLESQLVR